MTSCYRQTNLAVLVGLRRLSVLEERDGISARPGSDMKWYCKRVWAIDEEEKAKLLASVPGLLFKERQKSLGFIQNIQKCSSAHFTFMGKVIFLCVSFLQKLKGKQCLGSFIFQVGPQTFFKLLFLFKFHCNTNSLDPMKSSFYSLISCLDKYGVMQCIRFMKWTNSWSIVFTKRRRPSLKCIFKKIRLKQLWSLRRCSINETEHWGSWSSK